MQHFEAVNDMGHDEFVIFLEGEPVKYHEECWISRLKDNYSDVLVVGHGTKEGAIRFDGRLIKDLNELTEEVKKYGDWNKIYVIVCYPGIVSERYQNLNSSPIDVEIIGDWTTITYTQLMARNAYVNVTAGRAHQML